MSTALHHSLAGRALPALALRWFCPAGASRTVDRRTEAATLPESAGAHAHDPFSNSGKIGHPATQTKAGQTPAGKEEKIGSRRAKEQSPKKRRNALPQNPNRPRLETPPHRVDSPSPRPVRRHTLRDAHCSRRPNRRKSS